MPSFWLWKSDQYLPRLLVFSFDFDQIARSILAADIATGGEEQKCTNVCIRQDMDVSIDAFTF